MDCQVVLKWLPDSALFSGYNYIIRPDLFSGLAEHTIIQAGGFLKYDAAQREVQPSFLCLALGCAVL